MNKVKCELGIKEIKFVIEAIEFQLTDYNKKLNDDNIDEDEYSDLSNDSRVLEVIRDYMKSLL